MYILHMAKPFNWKIGNYTTTRRWGLGVGYNVYLACKKKIPNQNIRFMNQEEKNSDNSNYGAK